jgi:hypothetical protein
MPFDSVEACRDVLVTVGPRGRLEVGPSLNSMAFDDFRTVVLPQFFQASWLDDHPEIVFSDFPSRIRVGYVVREDGGYSYVLREHCSELRLTIEELHSFALDNLRGLPSGRITFADVPGGAEGFISADDNFAAARLLLPGVRGKFASRLGDEFLAVLPHRDERFCWSQTQDAERHSRHASEALEDFVADDYNLTPDILLVNAEGFRVYRDAA